MAIYFDNGSTSFPKAPNVAEQVGELLAQGCFNINRGGYSQAYSLADRVYDTRESLCSLFNFSYPSNVVFTQNITYALNMIIKGYLKSGDHVIVSSMEHNAMMRPLNQMLSLGVTFDVASANNDGTLDPEKVEKLIKPNTKAVMMLTASNVCGTLLPIKEVGSICKKRGIKFIVDSAQTAGVFPIDMKDMDIDILCFTGHKSLRGPQGVGGFLIDEEMIKQVTPIITGGTGSISDSEDVPIFMPDRFEAGTMNLPGIVGLNEALNYLNEYKMDNIRQKEMEITERFLNKALDINGVRVVGKHTTDGRAPIVSLDFLTVDNAAASFKLEDTYHIMTRCGLHCAPRAHKTLGTFPQGTVRFSFSHFNTFDEVDICIDAIKNIVNDCQEKLCR